jgi:Fe-S-cluster containining protein
MSERLVHIAAADAQLRASIDETMREAARRAGAWLACRAGCTPCCVGPFGITALDAWRLKEGMAALAATDAARAGRVRARAEAYVRTIAPQYPGNAETGELEDEDALPASMDEAPCPALDPDTGRCELYEWRPVTCRTFGPATKVGEQEFAACQLCYEGASEAEVAACAVEVDEEGLEVKLLAELGGGMTIVAYALKP